ncbi:mRNA-binding ribosome synthesis protein nop7 [Puccinia graminis f. sp. tritici]|uniref:Pescadillo homolog n=1 Tax=Puccinia graminis f. sp. tritici TaxID=56615 RepID=A0A5B0LT08_PUCGR|nr:mRNA-binding ribosome synthesis protein nop7 [Puccinia graminis f. sp. tritici]KAA1092210.1 mRNA-binding ribosome synthesis protein nop7 [Puccinia graminis f. sp. tritici]
MGRTAPAHIKTVKPGLKKKKGTTGAARNYVTRNQALKKLQCTLSDFRRLCILKGIYPREPRSRKKANRGSTAAASFYYQKDIAYLLHEPVLQKLREHKAFAKKLSRALGRKEDGLAKNLDSAHDGYRIDHIIKERYPVFTDAIRDLDDALSLIILFANLPSTNHVSPKVIANCARLAAEWQIYVMKSRSLKHVFLSIKGIYYQAEIEGQRVTWLVPYAFTQTIPADVDFRIMLTFLELYQTLLGFVFYRLFQNINLIYPPKLDSNLDEAAAGLNALILESSNQTLVADQTDSEAQTSGRQTAKSVRNEIKSLISAQTTAPDEAEENEQNEQMEVDPVVESNDEVEQGLFTPYAFFLSREVTRPMLEFVIKCSGGEVGWDPILGAGSPYLESDPRITHHVIDRPELPSSTAALPQRAFVQPQWVVDCINKSTLLPTEEYGPGKILPPHLSPFVDEEEVRRQGGYLPQASQPAAAQGTAQAAEVDEEEDASGDEEQADETTVAGKGEAEAAADRPALLAAASNAEDEDLLHAAEIEAEELGISHDQFQKDLRRATKEEARKARKSKTDPSKKNNKKSDDPMDEDNSKMAEMLLSSKQRKLYSKMSYTKHQRAEEKRKLESKKKNLMKKQK